MDVYSPSKLDSFEKCPRQYWYGYVGKVEIKTAGTVETFLGNRVHTALEQLYDLHQHGLLMAREQLLQWYEKDWDLEWNNEIRIVKTGTSSQDYRRTGQDCLSAYYDRYAPFDQSQTLGLESEVVFALDARGQCRMRGIIDRFALRQDGTCEVHDYKTSGTLMTPAEADVDRQLGLYQIGVMSMLNEVQQVDLIWHYLQFNEEIHSRRTPEQLQGLKAACIVLIRDIEALGQEEASFPTHPSRQCDWCDFREICPAKKRTRLVFEDIQLDVPRPTLSMPKLDAKDAGMPNKGPAQ